MELLTLEELNDKCRKHIHIETDQVDKAIEIIRGKLETENYEIVSGNTIKLYDCMDDNKNVAKKLFDGGILVTSFTVVGENLEEYYSNKGYWMLYLKCNTTSFVPNILNLTNI